MRRYSFTDFLKDIVAGVIVALVSIPISMGYAQVAGLPMQYGLYGSVVPIIIYGLITTTRNFVWGVDAAPAALVGGLIASLGIVPGSSKAVSIVPVITLMVSIWLLIFFLLKAGRIVKYISTPVMGGFVTGICCTIILMQFPKLYGGDPGIGEAYELVLHIRDTLCSFNVLSFMLGIGTVVIIVVSSKLFPKLPMPVLMMVTGFLLTRYLHIDSYGIKLLPHVDPGFPMLAFPMLTDAPVSELLFPTLTISLVIMAETLLASGSAAGKEGYSLNNTREILGYSLGNLAASLWGCCPVNGSVSRSSLAKQYGAATQFMSIVAGAVMIGVLLFLTPMIEYLPVPILTGIVVAALINACEFDLMATLWRISRTEFYIFISAFLGVLIFGTVYGVVIGVVLSFVDVIIKAVVPPKGMMGIIPGRDGFYALDRYRNALPIKDTLIYRFGGNLFFANVDTLETDIMSAVTPSTKRVIIYAISIGDIDVTAAERLVLLDRKLLASGIKLYITDHVGVINDKLRRYGAKELLYNGTVRRSVQLALRDAGIHKPYPVESGAGEVQTDEGHVQTARNELSTELEWIFGKDTEAVLEKLSEEVLGDLTGHAGTSVEEAESHTTWGRIGLIDEGKLLDLIEVHIGELENTDESTRTRLQRAVEARRAARRKRLEEDM